MGKNYNKNDVGKVPYIINYAPFFITRLIDETGKYYDSIKIADAKKISYNAKLDLVCFCEPKDNELALCKIVDFGKWKYSNEKSTKKNHQHKKTVKEVKFTVNIDVNDIMHKTKSINEFVEAGDDVILSMFLRGRERGRKQEAIEKMNNILSLCKAKEVSRKISENSILIRISK